MIKKLIALGVLGTVVMLSAGFSSAKAAIVYRRPVVYRPYRPPVWVAPRPYVYTYPTYTYPAPVVYGYANPYPTSGVFVGTPGLSVRVGR